MCTPTSTRLRAAYQNSPNSTKQMACLAGTVSLGPCGGQGGDHWSFRASSGITKIVINADNHNIKSISFTDANGNISGTYGGLNQKDLGQEKSVTIDWPSEYVTTISGTYGSYAGLNVITSLTFTTNLKTYGPFGGITGDQFSIPIANGVVVGFHGRSGYYLDALGIYVQPDGIISLGPWGGSAGTERPFSFKVANWIKEITIYYSQCIIGIAVKDADGNRYEKIGDEPDKRNQQTIKIAGPSEYVTSITGTYGKHKYPDPVVTSLSINTNLTTHGPFGVSNGTSFSMPIQNALVVGFHGRSGGYIDAIGIFVKPRPAI